jgi:hypothetical protein
LPGSQSRRTLEVVGVVVIVLPDAHRSLSIFARWHSIVPRVARGFLEATVEKGKRLRWMECPTTTV